MLPTSTSPHTIAASTPRRVDPPDRQTATTSNRLATMLNPPSGTAAHRPSPPRYSVHPNSEETVKAAAAAETPAMSPVRRMRASCGQVHVTLSNVAPTAASVATSNDSGLIASRTSETVHSPVRDEER